MSHLDFMAPNLGWDRPQLANLPPRPPESRTPRLPQMLMGNAVEARKDLCCLSVVGPMAIITLDGYLSYDAPYSWPSIMTADTELLAAIQHCRTNDGIAGVLFDSRSPGGSAGGTSDVMKAVQLLASEKPTRAIAHDVAASKAYMIAGLCARFGATPSAIVGSVGSTFGAIYDASKNLEDNGITPYDLSTGKAKKLGTYGLPVDPAEVEAMRATAMSLLSPILEMLSGPRRMTPERYLALEARIYAGSDAVRAGLVDEIADFETFASGFLAELQGGGPRLIVPIPASVQREVPEGDDDAQDQPDATDTEAARHSTQGVPCMSTNAPAKPAAPATPTAEARPLTLASLEANEPAIVGELTNKIKAELAKPTPASFDELNAAFGEEDPAFVTKAMAGKMTLVQAHAEYAKGLKAKLAATAAAPSPKKLPVVGATAPLAPTGTGGALLHGSTPDNFNAAVKQIQKELGCDFSTAWHKASTEYPELRQKYAEESTSKWNFKEPAGASA